VLHAVSTAKPELLFRTVHRSSALHGSELDLLLEPIDDSILHYGAEHDEVDQYLREGTGNWNAALGRPTDF
jgi:hypothetical protein